MKKNIFSGIVILVLFLSSLVFLYSFSGKKESLGEVWNKVRQAFVGREEGTTEQKTKTILKQSVVEEESAIIEVVDRVSPSVVSIFVKSAYLDPFSDSMPEDEGIGTGFIVDAKGVILTNSHVVDETNVDYSIVLKDGSSYDVVKTHRDPVYDLAFLEIAAKDLPVVELGDSSSLKVGQKAIAIGNALGQFSNTVTVGVVSGLGRKVTASGPFGTNPKTYNDVIQTDAAINPGNSGGPLLNLSGQVVGVNVATSRGAENISFAIPVDHVKPILTSFKEQGRIIRPYLGISFTTITKDLARFRRFPEGAYISRVVPGTPADSAGLQRGDIITKMGENEIGEENPLDIEIQQNRKVGERVKLTVDREGKIIELFATLAEAKEE